MIDQSQELLVSLLLSSFVLGVVVGAVYECIRFVKMFFGVMYGKDAHNVKVRGVRAVFLFILTFLSDFLFCIFISVVAVSLTYSMSGGVFRGMVYIGLFAGFALYYFTLGKLMLKINTRITSIIRKLFIKTVKIALIPIRGLFLLLIKCYRLTIGRIVDKIRMRAELSRREKEELQREHNAADGLLPECGGEESEDADKGDRYRKAERISFGQRKAECECCTRAEQ